MGLLLQNLERLRKEVEKAQGKISTATMKEWLGNQKAIKRECSLDDIAFEEKSAVVIVGISGIGKTTFAQEFLKKHPEFEFCSYDECYYQAARNLNVEGERAHPMTNQILEKIIRNLCRHGKNILFDGIFINYALRAAILQTLRDFGYKIHVVYFPLEYALEILPQCTARRAVELYLFNIETNRMGRPLSMTESLKIRADIMQTYCEREGKTPEEIYKKYTGCEITDMLEKELLSRVQSEIPRNSVKQQEEDSVFEYGAHYYYEIQKAKQ